MSYEGYEQYWCPCGHYWTLDCSQIEWDDLKQKCPICGEEEVRHNVVNLTNGSYDEETGERIDGAIESKIKKESIMKCKDCGTQARCGCTIYEIPSKEECSWD